MKSSSKSMITEAFVRWLVPFTMMAVVGWASWTIEQRVREVAETVIGHEIERTIQPRIDAQAEVIKQNLEIMRQVADTNRSVTDTLGSVKIELAELRGFVHAAHPNLRPH